MRCNPLLLLALLPCVVAAASAQGRNWDITISSGERFEDVDLVELRGDSLLIDAPPTARTIPLASIRELRRDDGSRVILGAVIGTAAGGALMWATIPTKGDGLPIYHMAGVTGLGMLLGTFIGANSRITTDYPLWGTTTAAKENVIREILEEREEQRMASIPTRRNVYVELGGNSRYYSVNYERIFWNHIAVRVGASYDPDVDLIVPMMLNALFFDGTSRLELGAGAAWAYDDSAFHPAIFAGYRHQPPEGGMMFRIGLTSFFAEDEESGVPELSKAIPVGLSFGYSF